MKDLESIAEGQEARLRLLGLIAERAQTTLDKARRETANTQRLWVNLCKKYGWVEDEDLWGG